MIKFARSGRGRKRRGLCKTCHVYFRHILFMGHGTDSPRRDRGAISR